MSKKLDVLFLTQNEHSLEPVFTLQAFADINNNEMRIS